MKCNLTSENKQLFNCNRFKKYWNKDVNRLGLLLLLLFNIMNCTYYSLSFIGWFSIDWMKKKKNRSSCHLVLFHSIETKWRKELWFRKESFDISVCRFHSLKWQIIQNTISLTRWHLFNYISGLFLFFSPYRFPFRMNHTHTSFENEFYEENVFVSGK